MNMYNTVISTLSLLATILVSISIYWLQKRHEKQSRDMVIFETARLFIHDNSEEIEYLPLCVISTIIDSNKKQQRSIYNNFNRCSLEVKNRILAIKEIPLTIPKTNKDFCVRTLITLFEKDAKRYYLGGERYDFTEYLNQCLDFRENAIKDENPHIFPNLSTNNRLKKLDTDWKSSAVHYIQKYLDLIVKDPPSTQKDSDFVEQTPPFNLVDIKYNFGTCELEIMLFWLMRLITSSCIAFFRHNLVNGANEEWRRHISCDAPIETYEDMYYYTILTLHTTYSKKP